MPRAQSQGARIYYEETGKGTPILFIHEFAGDHRSWADQVRYFGRGRRCITWDARGYPRSDCPEDVKFFGQEFFNRDAIAVLDAAKVKKAHVVGLSMGGYTALMLAAKFPERVISCVAAGAGSGSDKATRAAFIEESRARATAFERAGRVDAEAIGLGPARVQLQNKDPVGWKTFDLAEHSARGAAGTLRTVQAGRASLYELEAELRNVEAPVLLMVGDEDEPCLDVNLWMKRLMPTARLAFLPGSGHAINLEEPALFNRLVGEFIADVERRSWRARDPRSAPGALTSLWQPAAAKPRRSKR
jgi:pimeloyl-ACP methyl ester carboxylesterase